MSLENVQPLPWQQTLWATVAGARQRSQLSHAWLLSGPEGVGKRAFARAFAAALLCVSPDEQGQACGSCRACRMLANGGHPDAHLLTLDGHLGLSSDDGLQAEDGLSYWTPKKDSARRDIAVDAVRSLIGKLAVMSHLGGARVVVVHPASEMSDATANALLKTIEEPPANTFLLFLAEFPQGLKQTIRSRCQQLRFAAPGLAALDWLRARHPAADAELLAAAGGAPLKAAAWLANGESARRARWRSLLTQVAARRLDPLAAAVEIGKDKLEVAALCRYWQEQLAADLRDGGRWSARHESFRDALVAGLRLMEDQNASPQLLSETLLLRWRVLAGGTASA